MVVVVVVGTSPLVFFATFLDPDEEEEELEDEEDEDDEEESEGLGEGAFRLTPATGAAWVGSAGGSSSESESDELEDDELDEEEDDEEAALATTGFVAPIPGRVTGDSSSELESELESDEDDEEDEGDEEEGAGEGALAALGAATAVLGAPIPGRLTSSSSSLLDSELLDAIRSAMFPVGDDILTGIIILLVRLGISLGTTLFSLYVQKTRGEGGVDFLVRVRVRVARSIGSGIGA
jgi:hypothetical protein